MNKKSIYRSVYLLLFFLAIFFITPAPVESYPLLQSDSTIETIVVGVHHAPPFIIEGDDDWDGIAVHLWRDAANELELAYQWQEIEPGEIVSALMNGTIDVAIGTVANAESEGFVNFSQSYFVSTIGMAEPAQRTLWEIAGAFFSPRFWEIAMWLALIFFIIGIMIWLLERKSNEKQFGQNAIQGIWAGFWWAGVTMSTIGYGDKAPITIGGRVLALLWMLVAMGITATLTASLTTILASESGLGGTQFPQDLRSMSVGSLANSSSAELLKEDRVQFDSFDTMQAGLKAVGDGDIAVFVGDVTMLHFVNNDSMSGLLHVSSTGIAPQYRAFALPEKSELREPLNRIILNRIEESSWQNVTERYIPQQ